MKKEKKQVRPKHLLKSNGIISPTVGVYEKNTNNRKAIAEISKERVIRTSRFTLYHKTK